MGGDVEEEKGYRKLLVWEKSDRLAFEIYIATKKFPKEELFGLIIQLRRAVISYTSNIAEGFSRDSYKDKTRFYSIALGSLTEIQNQLLISRDLNYLSKEEFIRLANQTILISKITNGLIKKSKSIIRNS